MEDAKIIELFWERSEEAIAATDEKYGRYCYAIAYNILSSAPDSEECVNDTYLRVWSSIPPTRPSKFSAYLGRITRNLAINRVAYHSRQARNAGYTEILDEMHQMLPDENSTPQSTDDIALREAINGFLRTLPSDTRIIFLRRYWYNSSIADISRDYSLPQGTVKSTLSRTRKQFREYLQKEGISI